MMRRILAAGRGLRSLPVEPRNGLLPCYFQGMSHRLFILLAILASTCVHAQSADSERMFEAAWAAYREAAEAGDPAVVTDSLRVVLDVAQQTLPADDPRLPIAWMNYGNALANSGDFEAAEPFQEHAFKLAEQIYDPVSEDMVILLSGYADSKAAYDRSDEQEKYYRRALDIVEALYGEESIRYADLSYRAGTRVFDLSGTTGGRRFLEDAYAIYSREHGADSPDAAKSAHYLARIEQLRRKYSSAIEYLRLALDGMASDTKRQNQVRKELVILLEREGYPDEAMQHLLAIAETRPVEDIEANLPLYRAPVSDPRPRADRLTLETVDLEFTVDENGFVRDAVVVASSGSEKFEWAAIQSVRKWRYVPVLVDGQPIAARNVTARVRFPPRDDLPRRTERSLEALPEIPVER